MAWLTRSKKKGFKNLDEAINAVRETGLFLEEWYRKKNPDVAKAAMDPAEHYVRYGENEGRRPNPYFDPAWYRERAKGMRKFDGPALVHYTLQGWKNGRNPSADFSSHLYLIQYTDVKQTGIEPLLYHLTIGQYEGKAALHTMFHDDVTYDGVNSETQIEDIKTIAKSGLFDADWYRTYYTDLRHVTDDMLCHFIRHGANEGRQPNVIFNTNWYRQNYSDVIGEENPVAFYARKGWKLGHDPAPNFSTSQYFAENASLKLDQENEDALSHFLNKGHLLSCAWPAPKPIQNISKAPNKTSKLPIDDNLRAMIDFTSTDLAPTEQVFDKNALKLHWVIPDFAKGGGGHMTIFRIVSFFERMGHDQTIWINNPSQSRTDENAYDDIQKYFQFFSGDVKILDSRFTEAAGDAIIATDCWTVWPAMSASNFTRRFYFVQDFEPSFHPMGANYLAAEETYKQDIDCICASPWLAKLMEEKYGRWARPFWLAADTELYHPPKHRDANKIPRIAFYSRHFTARRAVELGMLALEVLAARGVEFIVDFFGAPLNFSGAPFPYKDHGVASPEELAKLFRGADLGVVFSATNYSLVPQEMMACGLPIVELRGESTECIFPEETVTLATPHPERIADALEALITDQGRRDRQAEVALEWVNSFSWETSAKLVETALTDRLSDFASPSKTNAAKKETGMKASVVIPTLNAGPILDRVLEAVTTQWTPWPYEILVIDSGSTDETLDTIAKYPTVRLHQIDKSEFNHGATRNLGAELTEGEFIAFLTHDALPANERWLYNLVSSVAKHPNAAGGFGKHVAYPEASAYTQRDLAQHFEGFSAHPLCLNKYTDISKWKSGDQGWRQLLHFYSDNNSIMRRSVWEKIPYRPVKFGEDQVWADDIIEAGYDKIYAVRSVVYHSHDYDAAETQDRSKTESAFFNHFFGYKLVKNEEELARALKAANTQDELWGTINGLPKTEIAERKALNAARLKGYLEGAEADTNGMF